MIILNVPLEFQPNYKSEYPSYSSGKNIEEIMYNYFLQNKDSINTNLIYIPIFWTSYYVINNYAENIQPLYNYLNTLDKSKKYFTVVQYAAGIFVKDFNLDITVFSAGGGGLNIKNDNTIKYESYYGVTRHVFYGNKGTFDIPLLCLPYFPDLNLEKTIYCSFMGRFDTHKCRFEMKNALSNNNKFLILESEGYEHFKEIINKSVFTLAPRGYGYTSFRIYEAIQANSIPIYIWSDKMVLPFSDIINWNDFSIIINSSEINKLEEILNNTNISEKQNNLKKVKHLFNFDETFLYIKNKIIDT